jgi:hypothetical protein
MRRFFPLVFLLAFSVLTRPAARAAGLLSVAAQQWVGERDSWSFTQHVREFTDAKVSEERVERYDPSQPEKCRWRLLELNGRAPTADETAKFSARKDKKRHEPKPLGDYIDFDHAVIASSTPTQIRYEVPLHDISWLLPSQKVAILITVNKASRAIDEVTVGLREPFRVAFGLARVTDVALDLHFQPSSPDDLGGPGLLQPSGTARVTVFKLGNRAEFSWSDFARVTPFAHGYAVQEPPVAPRL